MGLRLDDNYVSARQLGIIPPRELHKRLVGQDDGVRQTSAPISSAQHKGILGQKSPLSLRLPEPLGHVGFVLTHRRCFRAGSVIAPAGPSFIHLPPERFNDIFELNIADHQCGGLPFHPLLKPLTLPASSGLNARLK